MESVPKPEPILDFWGRTVGVGGGGVEWLWTNEWNAFAVSNRARGKLSRNSVSSAARCALNLFFCLEQETLRHSRFTIWQINKQKGRQHRITINYYVFIAADQIQKRN